MSAAIYILRNLPTSVTFLNALHLTTLDLSYTSGLGCNVTIFGLPVIQSLDLSGTDCTNRPPHLRMFRNISTLQSLKFRDSHITQDWLLRYGREWLSPLRQLQDLDLAGNTLRALPFDLLSHQSTVRSVCLAHNNFEELPDSLLQHPTLEELDMSDNLLHFLHPHTREALDLLAVNRTFSLHLRGNPLTCTCTTLEFVSWLYVTSVLLDGDVVSDGFDDDYDDNGRSYPCVLDDGTMTTTVAVMAQWTAHWRRCVGFNAFAGTIVALLCQLLGLLLTYLLHSKWTYVRHAWRVLRHLRLPRRQDFLYDALVLSCEEEEGLALKVRDCLLHARPEMRVATVETVRGGMLVTDGIFYLIEHSWKVVLVVTPTFLDDDVSGYSVLKAHGSISDVMPDRVLVLYWTPQPADLHPRPVAKVSLDQLLRTVPENSVYHVTDKHVTPRHRFWMTLARHIYDE